MEETNARRYQTWKIISNVMAGLVTKGFTGYSVTPQVMKIKVWDRDFAYRGKNDPSSVSIAEHGYRCHLSFTSVDGKDQHPNLIRMIYGINIVPTTIAS
jgi:hypothetical protein